MMVPLESIARAIAKVRAEALTVPEPDKRAYTAVYQVSKRIVQELRNSPYQFDEQAFKKDCGF